MLKRKAARRCSAQYYISAEEHVENEVKHERLLTETSRLSSSWAGLSVSCTEPVDCTLSSISGNNSPNLRPSTFSGPLVISVTCSNSPRLVGGNSGSINSSTHNKLVPSSPPHFSKSSSCHPSPAASPVSSRVQCYSPGLSTATSSPNSRRYSNTGGASPLLVSTALGRKRSYFACISGGGGGGSSDDASREGSPDSLFSHRNNKSFRQCDFKLCANGTNNNEFPYFRWPPNMHPVPSPSSPPCHIFPSVITSNTSSSPSSSLPSPPSSRPFEPMITSGAQSNAGDCSSADESVVKLA